MKYEIFFKDRDSVIIDDYGDEEIGIWEMLEDQAPEIYDQIDTSDIVDIVEIVKNQSLYP